MPEQEIILLQHLRTSARKNFARKLAKNYAD